jgi:hypothetical protein
VLERKALAMFGSQAIETAIGLVTMFFVLATVASAFTEAVARVMSKRAKDLERGLAALFKGEPVPDEDIANVLGWFKATSVWGATEAASGLGMFIRKSSRTVQEKVDQAKKGPSYLSAKMFGEAVMEMLWEHKLPTPEELRAAKDQAPALQKNPNPSEQEQAILHAAAWPENLARRLHQLQNEGRTDLLSAKSALEGWFDEAMGRVQGSYKRWSQSILFVAGLFLAATLNLSTISVASQLWQDPVTREAVANASDNVLSGGAKPSDLANVADAANKLDATRIPGGWSAERKDVWSKASLSDPWGPVYDFGGWLLTAFMVMLGGPFWFDLLSKLVALRGAGSRPDPATQDPSSATAVVSGTGTQPTPLLISSGEAGRQPQLLTEQRHTVTPAGPANEDYTSQVGL